MYHACIHTVYIVALMRVLVVCFGTVKGVHFNFLIVAMYAYGGACMFFSGSICQKGGKCFIPDSVLHSLLCQHLSTR